MVAVRAMSETRPVDVRSALRAQRRPVDAGKERVRLDLLCGGVAEAAFAVAEQSPHLQEWGFGSSDVWRHARQASGIRAQSSHEVLGLGRQCGFRRELEGLLVAEDLAARHQRVVAVEGGYPTSISNMTTPSDHQSQSWWYHGG